MQNVSKDEESSLNSYDPNGSQALQWKIGKIILMLQLEP